MKKTYRVEIDCSNCANLIEDAAKKVAGVKTVVVNFVAQKMTVEFQDWADVTTVMADVVRACKRVEPDCEISL